MSSGVTSVTETAVVAASTSISVVTTTSTSTSESGTSTIVSESTGSSVISVSSIFVTPSTTFVAAPTTQQSIVAVTSTITKSPASTGGTQPPSVVIITSTAPPSSAAVTTTPASSTSSSSTPSALSASGSGSASKSGLTTGGTIAIAVVIPIVAIAALFLLGLFFWRRRKQRKVAEEQRKAEIEDYGFNPNQDPTLATAAYAETGSEMAEDNNGYRGWGTTTSAQRKPSTTLGSGSRGGTGAAPGTGMSETSSTQGNNPYTHALSDDTAQNGDGISTGALASGAMRPSNSRRRSKEPSNIKRGPSNASSAYSDGPPQIDPDEPMPGAASGAPAPYYHEEDPYNYIDAQSQQGPYGDGTYHPSGQPVIRNNPARRNTRIERTPTFPNVGIAQNF